MADRTITLKTGIGEAGFWIFLAVMIVIFWGEPDLHDKLMVYLDHGCR